MLQVDNSQERFGDRVSIADLAINGFDRAKMPPPLSIKSQLERDWQWELEAIAIDQSLVRATFKDGSQLLAGDSYAKLAGIPAKLAPFPGAGAGVAPDGALWWSNAAPPPPVGTRIHISMNNCGPAIVTGYFRQDGFLGVLCRLEAAPDWHKKQNKGDPTGHVFGAEFRVLEDAS